MKRGAAIIVVLLVILNVPIILSDHTEAAPVVPFDPSAQSYLFYDDFESGFASWTKTGQVWGSTNYTTHGTNSAYVYNGNITRLLAADEKNDVVVRVDFLDPVFGNAAWTELIVWNATVVARIGTLQSNFLAFNQPWFNTWRGDPSGGTEIRLAANRSETWRSLSIYLSASKAMLMVDQNPMYTVNLTDPLGCGFNSSNDPQFGFAADHVYIDQFVIYQAHQTPPYAVVNPVILGANVAWRSSYIGCPTVIHNASANKYWLYYYGFNGANSALGKINSTDGLSWDLGNNSWIRRAPMQYIHVVQGPNLIKLFYVGLGGGGLAALFAANSTDGVNFTDDYEVLSATPNEWDEQGIYNDFVWYDAGSYYAIYSSVNATYGAGEMVWGIATSPDGFSWTKNPANPVFTLHDHGIAQYTGAPYINRTGSTYHMVVEGYFHDAGWANTGHGLFMFESTDLVTWTNATIQTLLPSGEWCRPAPGGAAGSGFYLTDAFMFNNYTYYIAGDTWGWLAQAKSNYTFHNVADGQILQWSTSLLTNCANNVTAAGTIWNYGADVFKTTSGNIVAYVVVTPIVGPVNITSITAYAPGSYNQSDVALTIAANQTVAGQVAFSVLLHPNLGYVVYKDGSAYSGFRTSCTGWHTWTYGGAWSAHTFTFRVSYASISGVTWTYTASEAQTLRASSSFYPPGTLTSTYLVLPYLRVGQYVSPMPFAYQGFRDYLSFNTSSLPDTCTILSAELELAVKTPKWGAATDFNVLVYGSNYTTLSAGDYNTTFGTLQGTLMAASSGVANTWYSIPIATEHINKSGATQFMFRSNRDNVVPPPWANETMWFWGMTGGYIPRLIITIQVLGTTLAIQRDSGAWYNSSIFPEVQEWNLTYDLLYFSFSTIPSTRNATIFKGSSLWAIQGVAPACNFTDNSTETRFEDCFDSIEYKVWFTSPKAFAYTLCHVALYDAFTGEGMFWEATRVVYSEGDTYNVSSAQTMSNPDIYLEADRNFTFTVMDYFGNLITNYTIYTSAASQNVYIPVPVYSYKFYNQNPVFALLRIHYNLTGAPYSEFIPPYDYVNRYLKAGTYRFNITFYNASGYAGSTYTWVRTIPSPSFPGAGYVILEGDTISEAIAAAEGVRAIVQVVADLVTPDVIWIGLNMPQVPAYLMDVPNAVVFDNRYLVDADTVQNGSGWLMNFSTPIPLNVTVSTPIADDFRFVGNLSTWIFVNSSAATVYTNANLPAGISLSAGTYTIWTNRTVSVIRDTHFRWQKAFSYQYFPGTDMYDAIISFNNSVTTQWRNVTVFIPFQNNSKVNNGSVLIFDMNNTVYLTEGVNYVLSSTGIHMWFTAWNASLWRGFHVTYTTVNESEFLIPAVVKITQVGDGTTMTMVWSSDTYYYCVAEWTNTYRQDYAGPLYITMDIDISIDAATVVVLDENDAVVTTAVVFGNTVAVPEINLPVGEKVTFVILFKSQKVASPMDLTFAGIPVMYVAIAVMLAAFILGVILHVFQRDERAKQFGRVLIGVAVLALGFIIVVLIYFTASG